MRDTAEFDAFYTATSHRLIGQLYTMTGDLAEAEDVLQEAYIRAWQNWPKISTYQDPEGWVRSVAFRLSINAWRKARNRVLAHQRSAPRETAVPAVGSDTLAVAEALRRLPEKPRWVMVLHYLADLPVEQIARETGMPEGTVKSHLSRARTTLATLLAESDTEPDRPRRIHTATERVDAGYQH